MTAGAIVTRFVPTYINAFGRRVPMRAGRHTFATADEARGWIRSVLAANSPEALTCAWGTGAFIVRPVECYADCHCRGDVDFDL